MRSDLALCWAAAPGHEPTLKKESEFYRTSMWPFLKRTEQPKLSTAPTPEMIAEAKLNPNGWVYQIDGKFGPLDAVPPECIVGAYKVDVDGRLTGEFQANPKYRSA